MSGMSTGGPVDQAPATTSHSTAQPSDIVGYADQLQLRGDMNTIQGNTSKGVQEITTGFQQLGTLPKVLPSYQVQQTDPREEQHRLWNACLERNMQLVHDTGAAAYRPAGQVQGHGAQSQHDDGMQQPVDRDVTSGLVLDRPQPSTRNRQHTQEQAEYLTNLASQRQAHTTTKDSMMHNIASQLQNMGLKEIRDFEASLPSALSNVRHSRRLQGAPPDTVESTGSQVEDSRLLFKGDTIYYRK